MKDANAATTGSGIPLELLKEAMAKDFEQHMIDAYTPDRGYPFPTDHVVALIAKYWPNNEVSEPARDNQR